MGKKILKGIMWIFIGIAGLFLLVTILVYLPPVQNFIKDKAATIVSDATGMKLSIDRFRLRFPLHLTVDNTILITGQGDTLIRAGQLQAGVAFWPLLAGQVQVNGLGLTDAGVHYADTLSAMTLKGTIAKLGISSVNVGLKNNRVKIGNAALSRADIDLWLGESRKPDTINVDTVPSLWRIGLERFDIDQLGFRMHTWPTVTELTADLEQGRIDKVDLDLGRQIVNVGTIRLRKGQYTYQTDTTTVIPAPVVSAEASASPWTIGLKRLELSDNGLVYGVLNGEPTEGFDLNHIRLSAIEVRIDDVRYNGTDIAAEIRELTARERSGLEVTKTSGRFSMDSARIKLSDFQLQTAASTISARAEVAPGVLEQDPQATLSAVFSAEISPQDLYYFYRPDAAMRRTLNGQTLRVNGGFSGTLTQLNIETLRANVPGHVDLNVDGAVSNVLDRDRLAGNVRLAGDFRNLDFLRPMLPDSMRDRIGFPDRMRLTGSLSMDGNTYAPNLRLSADSGLLAVNGRINLNREEYLAEVEVTDFPLDAFLPQDSLGLLSLNLTADGHGFDPRQEGAAAEVSLLLNRFDYREYIYRDIRLDAKLAEHLLAGQLSGDDEAVQLQFDLTGELRPEKYAAHLTGKIDTLDLHRMGFLTGPFDASVFIEAQAVVYPDTTLTVDLLLDSIRWRHDLHTDYIARTTFVGSSEPGGLTGALRSGDLALDFNAPVSMDSLLSALSLAGEQVMAQVEARSLNMAKIQEFLPPFDLTVSAARDNILHTLVSASGVDFQSLTLNATTLDSRPFRVNGVINKLETAGLTLDTLNLGLLRRDDRLDYFVRLANRPGNIEEMALIAVGGSIVKNRAEARFLQRNRSDSVGFSFGLNAELLDSLIRVRMTPERPIFGYIPWRVNPDNYLTCHFNNMLDANLRLEGPAAGQHIYIISAPLEPSLSTGAIKLDMAGIDIESALQLLPSPPAVGGILKTDIGVGFDRGQLAVAGSVGVDDLAYGQRRVGSIGADLNFQSDSLNRFMLDAALSVDGQQVLKADGTYLTAGDGSLALRASIPSFPLAVANAFLPEDIAQLAGKLSGWASVSGSTANPVVNGELTFSDGQLTVPMIGTSFGLSARPIRIDNSRLNFNRFGLVSPNDQNFTIDGTVDFSDLSRMTTDLALHASNFNAIQSGRGGGSQIYGQAPIDVNLTAKGIINSLTVRGDVRLRRGTDITYTLREGPLEVQSVKQDLVTFVDFNDPATFEPADQTDGVSVFGIDMLVNIDIEENIQATVNISEEGNNRAEIAGNGNLTFTMNTQGDTRFMGRFDIASGRILYNPPVISQKDFAINEDSYVEWTGEMLNPTFDITAVETVRATVTYSDTNATPETVNFNVSIIIRNTLEEIDLAFDLTAPNNLRIQTDLQGMPPEQRSQQAMALLIYNTYTGPGSSATVDSNNPLNALISRELNQWARNNLQGVDLSVGLDTVDDAAGGTHTNYSYQVSKSFMNDRVKVTVGGSINSDQSADQNIQNNFVDDITIEYRLTERDNMFLKAYRYNTQESILEGEVVETGGGFLLRKKMNRLGDLFKLTPKQERQQRREMRREIRHRRRDDEAKAGIDPAGGQSRGPVISEDPV